MIGRLAIAIIVVASLIGSAAALTTNLVATIDGAQASAGQGTGSAGTGSATITYDSDTGLFSWNISWSGLTGNETIMHFHGPAPAGVNAGIQVNFGAISGIASPSIGAAVITPAQATDLLNELWYINIHTDVFNGGEIRGQVLVNGTIPTDSRSWGGVKSLYQ